MALPHIFFLNVRSRNYHQKRRVIQEKYSRRQCWKDMKATTYKIFASEKPRKMYMTLSVCRDMMKDIINECV
uniref:Zinc finger protein 83 n=1 Tax=Nomascus leucogenys TaxID=61853 RepID=G1R295_NOMLE